MKTNFYKKNISIIIMFFLFLITIQGQEKSIKIIPVVVHVVYKTAAQNVSDQRIFEQIEVLNQDFRRLNSDTNLTPTPFKPVAADCEIEFVLANQTPQGLSTTGIIRVQTTVTSFTNSGDPVKHVNSGGSDAWDPTQYLNIWICNLSNGLIGYSTTPDNINNNDGVVVYYQCFGLTGATPPYNKGRTTTQLVGQWFGLHNLASDHCINPDGCNDIPPQSLSDISLNVFPQYDSCTTVYPGIMFMNFMSFSDDVYLNLFTQCQKLIMNATLNNTRISLLTSQGYTQSEIILFHNFDYNLYPNPAHDFISINLKNIDKMSLTISIMDLIGRKVFEKQNIRVDNKNYFFNIDTQKFTNGIYEISITTGHVTKTKRIEICK